MWFSPGDHWYPIGPHPLPDVHCLFLLYQVKLLSYPGQERLLNYLNGKKHLITERDEKYCYYNKLICRSRHFLIYTKVNNLHHISFASMRDSVLVSLTNAMFHTIISFRVRVENVLAA